MLYKHDPPTSVIANKGGIEIDHAGVSSKPKKRQKPYMYSMIPALQVRIFLNRFEQFGALDAYVVSAVSYETGDVEKKRKKKKRNRKRPYQ